MNLRLNLKPFSYQLNFWKEQSGRRFIALAGGRRVGKSLFSLYWLLRNALESEPDGMNVWISPTMRQALRVGLIGMQGLVGDWPKGLVDTKLSDSSMKVAGRDFFFTSSDNAEGLRGMKFKRVVFDEAAFQREYVWSNVVRPALADLHGSALLCSTYNGFNWFYELMHNPSFLAACWPTSMNPIIAPDELEDMKHQMDQNTYMQEILAVPTTAKGLVYESTFSKENILDDYKIQTNDVIGLGMDFGYNDPCAVSFFAMHPDKHGYPVVIKWGEIYESKQHVETILEMIIAKLMTRGIKAQGIPIGCDIAGKQTTGVDAASYISRIESKKIFRLHYKKMDILSGVNLIRAYFLNAAGTRRFFICRECNHTIRSYSAYEIKDKERPFGDSKNDHLPDADRYYFENLIRPLIPQKQVVDRKLKSTGKAETVICLRCGKKIITFKKETHCLECQEKVNMEI